MNNLERKTGTKAGETKTVGDDVINKLSDLQAKLSELAGLELRLANLEKSDIVSVFTELHDLEVELYNNVRYNGKLLWKIDDYNNRKHKAITGKITALHSPPFYCELNGYKACLNAY